MKQNNFKSFRTLFLSISVIILIGGLIKYFKTNLEEYHFLGWQNTIKQTKSNNCGPVALSMIFQHFKISHTLLEIEDGIPLKEKGASMWGLKSFSEKKGLLANGIQTDINNLQNHTLPLIAYINNDHFVLVDSIYKNSIYLRDPARGRIFVSSSYFSKIWDGSIIEFKKL